MNKSSLLCLACGDTCSEIEMLEPCCSSYVTPTIFVCPPVLDGLVDHLGIILNHHKSRCTTP